MGERYNGWTNYETWAVALWIDNDQGSHEYWRERARECCRQNEEQAGAENDLANDLNDEHEQGKDELLAASRRECSVWADLLSAAVSAVNWLEIAHHFIGDVWDEVRAERKEEEPEEE